MRCGAPNCYFRLKRRMVTSMLAADAHVLQESHAVTSWRLLICRQSRQRPPAISRQTKRPPVRSKKRGNFAGFPCEVFCATNPHENPRPQFRALRQPLLPREGPEPLEGPLERRGPAGRLWVWGWRARGSRWGCQTPAFAGKEPLYPFRAQGGAGRPGMTSAPRTAPWASQN